MDKGSREEKRRHSSLLIPYSYYSCSIPEYFTSVPPHWHNEFEISYVLKGGAEFFCGEEHFCSAEGDIILLSPNMLHAVYSCGKQEQRYDTIVFSGKMLGAEEDSRCAAECIRPLVNGSRGITARISRSDRNYTALADCTQSIFFCAKANTPQHDLLLKSELLKLFWLLEQNGYLYPKARQESGQEALIRPIIGYIHAHFREKLSIEQLAQLAHLSKSYFMSCFRKTAGIGAMELVLQLRIQSACEKLVSTDETITSVAFQSGFENLSNFNRQFRKRVGCTPAEFRRLNRRATFPDTSSAPQYPAAW